jgi:ribosomal protein S27E
MATVLVSSEVCRNCRWELVPGDHFCAYCGVEAAAGPPVAREPGGARPFTRAECPACGASMAYDAALRAVACPFCGSLGLSEVESGAGRVEPTSALPFQVSAEAATAAFGVFAKSSWWYPDDLAAHGRLTDLRRVFVPAWCFRGAVASFWTADTTDGARRTWRPIAGTRRRSFEDVVVLASTALTPLELAGLAPFRLRQRIPLAQLPMQATDLFETARLSQHAALRSLPATVQSWEQADLAPELPGETRKVHADQLITDVRGELVLVPVWIAAYRYGETVYRFLVNGDTGKATGTAPTSWFKVVGLGLLLVLAGLVIWLLVTTFAGP